MVVIGTLVMTPTYKASTTIRVAMVAGGAVSYTDYMYAERLMNTYTKIATSGPVLEELTQQLGGHALPQIEVKVVPDTELMRIVVQDTLVAMTGSILIFLLSGLVLELRYSGYFNALF